MIDNNACQFIVDEEFHDWRIDLFLAHHIPTISRVNLQKKIKNGDVKKNNTIINKAAEKIEENDVCEIILNNEGEIDINLKPNDLDLNIVYEDEHLLIINKSPAMTVHPGVGTDNTTMVHGLLFHCRKNLANIHTDRPGIVHRLDRDTSGLIIVAKTNESHLKLSAMIKDRQVTRKYKAICYGMIKPLHGTIDLPVARCQNNPQIMQINMNGKNAVTHYKTLEIFHKGFASLLECQLETGRTHQIRLHLAHQKHGIIGDKVYGKQRNILMKRQALHAFSLQFIHPILHQEMNFSIELPPDMQQLIERIRVNKLIDVFA